MAINKRSIVTAVILTIVTFGIYGIYWQYLLVKNVRALEGNSGSVTGEMLCIVFVPFYSLYWWYTRGVKTKTMMNERQFNPTGDGIIYLLLGLFGLGIVSSAIMQNDFNEFAAVNHL